MFHKITQRLRNEEDGFTLIELMVVVLIIAILIAIAIPTFLGARERAQDRAAQSSNRNAVTAAKAIFTDNEDYASAVTDGADADAFPDQLTAGEPSLDFRAAAVDSTDSTMVSVGAAAVNGSVKSNRFFAAVQSDSGKCWYVQDVVGPSGTANSGTTWQRQDQGSGACSANDAPAYDNAGWEKKASNAVDF